MAEIEQYTVLDSDNLNKLASDVTAMLIEGWEPQGGIAVESEGEMPTFCQAMIKRAD